jgi:uncharacterized protein YqeY
MLEEQINKDYIQAMKDRDSVKSSTLNFLRASIKNVRIEKRIEKVEDIDVTAVIKKQVKQRQDSIEQYKAGGRPELAQKEETELTILKSYLPKEMSEDEINQVIQAVMKEVGASSPKDMGKVIKPVMEKLAGKADNKTVSDLVKKNLS